MYRPSIFIDASIRPPSDGDAKVKDSAEVLENWGKLKAREHEKKGKKRRILDGVPQELPALLRAQRLGEKAAAVGFDWPDVAGVRDKIDEELQEIEEAVAAGDPAHIEHEVGDLLLAVSRYAAKLGVAPEDALRGALKRSDSSALRAQRSWEWRCWGIPLRR